MRDILAKTKKRQITLIWRLESDLWSACIPSCTAVDTVPCAWWSEYYLILYFIVPSSAWCHLIKKHTFRILLEKFKTQVCLIHCYVKNHPSNACFGTYLYSVGTRFWNLLKLPVIMSRVDYFIPLWACMGNCISPNQQLKGRQRIRKKKVNGPAR